MCYKMYKINKRNKRGIIITFPHLEFIMLKKVLLCVQNTIHVQNLFFYKTLKLDYNNNKYLSLHRNADIPKFV